MRPCLLLLTVLLPLASTERPSRHIITGLGPATQINGLTCGAGSLASIFAYLNPAIDQRAIANVARTSSCGTWTFDIVRAGRFSQRSAAQGNFYPHDIPTAGYPGRSLGYASFGRSDSRSWLDAAKSLVAQDMPVLVLQKFSPTESGGHYRVLVGYDDAQALVWCSDPWGRSLKKDLDAGLLPMTESDFNACWDYTESGTGARFFGAVMMPWHVGLAMTGTVAIGNTVTVQATVTYPCPVPFLGDDAPAREVIAELSPPPGVVVLDGTQRSLGSMAAGTSQTCTWQVRISSLSGTPCLVTAAGLVGGSVPKAAWNGNHQVYPAYTYDDLIGGTGFLDLAPTTAD